MPKIEKIGRVTTASVHKGTKRHWDEWVSILNKAGAKNWTHSEIARYLGKRYKLTTWWQQGVAIGYEIATGLRSEGQNHKGEYACTVTKSFPCGAKQVWKTLLSPEGIQAAFRPMGDMDIKPKQQFENEGGVYGEIRTVKEGSRVRFSWTETDWPKATTVTMNLIARKNKSMFWIQHEGLKSARQKEELRALWRERIEALLVLCLAE
jgi:uncharacterized protein YndB with AHSA1/START domain